MPHNNLKRSTAALADVFLGTTKAKAFNAGVNSQLRPRKTMAQIFKDNSITDLNRQKHQNIESGIRDIDKFSEGQTGREKLIGAITRSSAGKITPGSIADAMIKLTEGQNLQDARKAVESGDLDLGNLFVQLGGGKSLERFQDTKQAGPINQVTGNVLRPEILESNLGAVDALAHERDAGAALDTEKALTESVTRDPKLLNIAETFKKIVAETDSAKAQASDRRSNAVLNRAKANAIPDITEAKLEKFDAEIRKLNAETSKAKGLDTASSTAQLNAKSRIWTELMRQDRGEFRGFNKKPPEEQAKIVNDMVENLSPNIVEALTRNEQETKSLEAARAQFPDMDIQVDEQGMVFGMKDGKKQILLKKEPFRITK